MRFFFYKALISIIIQEMAEDITILQDVQDPTVYKNADIWCYYTNKNTKSFVFPIFLSGSWLFLIAGHNGCSYTTLFIMVEG